MLTPEEEARKAKLLKELKDLEDGASARSTRSRTYGFASVTDPEKLAMIQRFQRIFGRHIPHLLKSESATISLHQELLDGIFGNPIQTMNKSTFEADLKRFRGAINVLAEWPIWGKMVYFDVVPIISSEFRDNENVLHVTLEIYDCLLRIGDMSDEKKLPQVLDQLESWAREASEYLMDHRNIKWEAVNAVDRLRGTWESYTETPAPRRALNPASPFADYLRDAFEFFNISGDPVAAFKRWVVVEDAWVEIRIRKWK